jgi:hypothetical protein
MTTLFGDTSAQEVAAGALSDRFVVPPFSVLDTRAGYWQDRRRAWLGLGLRSEMGRLDDGQADALGLGAFDAAGYAGTLRPGSSAGVSIFDPVLCELAYRWFAPSGGTVLDPFAGGSVRGVVAEYLGHPYTGIDLNRAQVDANRAQADDLGVSPLWIVGDSRDLDSLVAETERYDLVFSCPPYYDLEVYSDLPADLSTAPTYGDFLTGYREVIKRAAARLRPNRFAVWVVSDVRSPDGDYRGLVADTIRAFGDAGLRLYNEAIVVNAVGTAALRAPRYFESGRKLVRTHQQMLVFTKGRPDPRQWSLDLEVVPPSPQMTWLDEVSA